MRNAEDIESELNLAKDCFMKRDFVGSELSAQKVIAATESSRDFAKIHITALLIRSTSLKIRGNALEALQSAEKALELAKNHTNKDQIARSLNIIANIYLDLANFDKASEYYAEALAIHQEMESKRDVASVLGNIGNVYVQIKDYDHAFEFYRQSLAIYHELKDEKGASVIMGNMGVAYSNTGDVDNAIESCQQALHLYEKYGMKEDAARVIGNIGSFYYRFGDYRKAAEYLQKALDLSEKIGNLSLVSANFGNLGTLYLDELFEEYDLTKAEIYLLQALKICEELDTKYELCEVHKNLSALYKKQMRWAEFARHIEQYQELKDKLRLEETAKQAQKFVIEQKVAVMQKEREILYEKNSELAKLNAELAQKNLELMALNEEKNEFLGIAAHDLKNPLNAIAMLAQFLEEDAPSFSYREIQDFASDIRTSSNRMFELIVNLLDVNKIEQGGGFSEKTVFSADEAVKTCAEIYEKLAESKNIRMVTTTEKAVVELHKPTLMQIVENLISNALKYSPSDRTIYVNVERL